MNKFKGTPGPWEIKPEEVDKSYIRIRGTVWGGRFKIANVLMPNHEGLHPNEVIETRANARLIAASPKLLQTLQFIVEKGDTAIHRDDLKAAKELINEVLGEVK